MLVRYTTTYPRYTKVCTKYTKVCYIGRYIRYHIGYNTGDYIGNYVGNYLGNYIGYSNASVYADRVNWCRILQRMAPDLDNIYTAIAWPVVPNENTI